MAADDSWAARAVSASWSPRCETVVGAVEVGRSGRGRPIEAVTVGAGAVRVFVVAGQHGDEALARRAARRFAEVGAVPGVSLTIVADANPDGAALGQRRTPHNTDLNRDHAQQHAPETRALHRLVATARPHLVIDVHTYPPRRRVLLKAGLVLCHDVFVETVTNPAAVLAAGRAGEQLHEAVVTQLTAAGFRAGRYTLVRPRGLVRHGTYDILDARNGLALRFGVPTLLLEGRQPTRADPPDAGERTVAALVAALDAAVRWAARNRDALRAGLRRPGPGDHVPLRVRTPEVDRACVMPFADTRTGRVFLAPAPGRYRPHALPDRWRALPLAYALAPQATELGAALVRHGLPLLKAPHGRCFVERPLVRRVRASRRDDRSFIRLEIDLVTELATLDGHVLVPVTSAWGAALAVWLEADSAWSLGRLAGLAPQAAVGWPYPVLRVLGM